MDFVLYSTHCGWDIENSTYHDYYNKLNKAGVHWYAKEVKLNNNSRKETPVTFVTVNSAEDFIALSKALNQELIIEGNHHYWNFPVLEIYDDYRE
jgi:hypothetical protein